jgi:hypothetical protein
LGIADPVAQAPLIVSIIIQLFGESEKSSLSPVAPQQSALMLDHRVTSGKE